MPPQEYTAFRHQRLRNAGKYTVTGVKMYPQGTIQLVRQNSTESMPENGKRSEVCEFSRQSRERLAFVSRETSVMFNSMLTLTYGKQFPRSGKQVKQHLNRFLTWYRRYCGCSYLWWLEFQERGAPHIHIASAKGDVKWYDRETFADKWAKSQGLTYGIYYSDLETKQEKNIYDDVYSFHSHRKAWENAKKRDGPKRYILKYALKMRQKVVPPEFRDVGRFWGASRDVWRGVPEPEYLQMDESDLRDILAAQGHMCASWDTIPKNIWGVKGAREAQAARQKKTLGFDL